MTYADNYGINDICHLYREVENNEIDLGVSLADETDLYIIDKMYNKAAADGFNNAVYYTTSDNVDFILSNSDIVSISKVYKKITAKKLLIE